MSDRDKVFARTTAALDQMWATMADRLGDIQSLAMRLQAQTDLTSDEELTRVVMWAMTAELYQRSSQSREAGAHDESQGG